MPRSSVCPTPASGELIPRFEKYNTIEAPEEAPGSLVSGVYGEEGGSQEPGPLDVGGSNYWLVQ